ncbi:SDR family NAD(P)-dependent oxidoreductase [Shewanella glacialipiscicola]|uniref:SDR family NAD(P)-dependent oxidoreductase n=1 Tax=Shewanella glacialipiscicola TaxID=614069 RepID=UPI003D7B34BB
MKSKLILVTGVSSGIGFQITSDLLASGYSVLGVSRNANDKVEELLVSYPLTFYFESVDLTADIDSLPKWVVSQSKLRGRFAGFVHSAGIQQTIPLQINTYGKMLEIFNLNVFAGLALARGVSDKRVMQDQGGSILFISSIASKIGQSGLVNYSASKAALNGAMRSMAKELSPRNICVNSVLPGFVMTEMIEKWQDVYNADYINKINEQYPLGIGKAQDISNLVCFLLDEKSRWITGSEFDVNGGASLGA